MRVAGTRAAAVAVVAAVALLQCCGRCACAPGRPRVMRRAVVEMLARDQLYADVLAEHVTQLDDVPAGAETTRLTPAGAAGGPDVDPLPALMALVTPGDYQSGRDLKLAAAVLAAAVRCFVYKRVAVNVLLLTRAVELGAADADVTARVDMQGRLLLLAADMLSALGARHDELIALLSRTKKHRLPESLARDDLTAGLKEGTDALNAAVGSACKTTDVVDYMVRLSQTADPAAAAAASAEPAAATAVESASLDVVLYLLNASENAVQDEYERMYMLRTADVAVWRKLFDFPELPPPPPPAEGAEADKVDKDDKSASPFKRTAPPKYRDTVVKLMDRTAKTAALMQRQAERVAAANKAPAVADYEERPIPMTTS